MTGFRFPHAGAAALLLAVLVGCGGSQQRASVEGSVTYDGSPIDNGTIAFVPDGGTGSKVTATVSDGKYAIERDHGPAPGKYKVEITWNKAAKGKKIDPDIQGPAMEGTQQVLPDKFNKATTLTAEIKPGANQIDFPLTK